jgi:hypothetical protein
MTCAPGVWITDSRWFSTMATPGHDGQKCGASHLATVAAAVVGLAGVALEIDRLELRLLLEVRERAQVGNLVTARLQRSTIEAEECQHEPRHRPSKVKDRRTQNSSSSSSPSRPSIFSIRLLPTSRTRSRLFCARPSILAMPLCEM